MFSEVSVVEGLTRIFPYGNIDHIGNKINNSGDIILTRKDHSPIMIENKEYDGIVSQNEIQKFIDNAIRINAGETYVSSSFLGPKFWIQANGSTLIGAQTYAAASALVELRTTTQGFLPPRMTTTQKNAIATPANGLVVFDTTLNKLCVYTTAWETITSA
jgi:hypothetical protein